MNTEVSPACARSHRIPHCHALTTQTNAGFTADYLDEAIKIILFNLNLWVLFSIPCDKMGGIPKLALLCKEGWRLSMGKKFCATELHAELATFFTGNYFYSKIWQLNYGYSHLGTWQTFSQNWKPSFQGKQQYLLQVIKFKFHAKVRILESIPSVSLTASNT